MKEFNRLKEIVARLRAPDGCPWDKEQSHESLRPLILEEVHEALDALYENDMEHFQEELGDILLHIFFHAQIAEESGIFNIESVGKTINEKLIRRHPHVFGDLKFSTPEEAKKNWDKIKKNEKESNGKVDSEPFSNIPKGMGALARSRKMGEIAAKYKFDWEEISDIKLKIMEEIEELEEAIQKSPEKNSDSIKEEFGDLLFSLSQWARRMKIDPEDALIKSNTKFSKRFNEMMRIFSKENEQKIDKFRSLSLDEKEDYWKKAKDSVG